MKVLICPYCGDTQSEAERCRSCGGLFEPLSRQATHNAMGPWFFRDEHRPYQPGASYETIIKLIERGQITKYSIIRGPTTKQFWTVAKRVPGIAHLLGYCHNCDASVDGGDHGCHACGVPFGAYLDRNFLGLPDIRPLPWEAAAEDERNTVASATRLEFRRAVEPLGISSFASDDELRGQGLSAMPAYAHLGASEFGVAGSQLGAAPKWSETSSGSGSAIANALTAQQTTAKPSATTLLEPSPDGVAARAIQRKLVHQRQLIKLLVAGVFVMALITIVTLAALLAANAGRAEPAAQTRAADAAPAVVEPLATAATIDYAVEHARAMQLIEQAPQTDRQLPDRIRDYQEGLAILKNIQQHAPAQQMPVDIDSEIKRVEHELERLRLHEFFP